MNKVIIFSAPSGAGKSSIVKHLLEEHPELNLVFSVSATSRSLRGEEKHGVDYFFLTEDDFKERIEKDEFLEHEEVYTGRFYGTLKQHVEDLLLSGKNVLFDIDVVGGLNIKKYYGDNALAIFIQPPSIDELEERLKKRNTDTPEAIRERVEKAVFELTFAPQFDIAIVNDKLDVAQEEAYNAIHDFLEK